MDAKPVEQYWQDLSKSLLNPVQVFLLYTMLTYKIGTVR